jgi:hypothetical protein
VAYAASKRIDTRRARKNKPIVGVSGVESVLEFSFIWWWANADKRYHRDMRSVLFQQPNEVSALIGCASHEHPEAAQWARRLLQGRAAAQLERQADAASGR